MPLHPRQVTCECCPERATEAKYGDGFPGWTHIASLQKNGHDTVLCPTCWAEAKAHVIEKSESRNAS